MRCLPRAFAACLAGFALLASGAAAAEEWFRSNAAGMGLEFEPSRAAALRNRYALSVKTAGNIPPLLRQYFQAGFLAELRTLYENGKELRRQWIFRDDAGTTRLAASGDEGFFGGAAPAAKSADGDADEEKTYPRGFIEVYNEKGLISVEREFSSDGLESQAFYYYNGAALVRGELFEVSGAAGKTAVAVDAYRYARSGSLRAIDRRLSGGGDGAAPLRLSLPRLSPGTPEAASFVTGADAYASSFIQDAAAEAGGRIVYATDSRGRVLTETHIDEEGETTGTLTNVWSGDRLVSSRWVSGDEDRLTEFEYDGEGGRVKEKNYRKGVLERTVETAGEREIETLYMNGKPALRAVWENGRKVSEEPAK